ncbi:MAG TPA: hypothetical protein VNS58_24560 [Puia sp.]|nr:hypothetical protein [Puia sp.]
MKFAFLQSLLLASHLALPAQNKDTSHIALADPADQILAPLKYLASDQLKGRHIGLSEIDTAARYIADQFKQAGAKTVAGASGYFQSFTRVFNPLSRTFRNDPQSAANMPWHMAALKGLTLKNVLAFVPGTDHGLREQYVILSSHYDHEGVADTAAMEDGKMGLDYRPKNSGFHC